MNDMIGFPGYIVTKFTLSSFNSNPVSCFNETVSSYVAMTEKHG